MVRHSNGWGSICRFSNRMISEAFMRIILSALLLLLFSVFIVAQVEDDRLRQEREDRENAVIRRSQEAMTPGFESFIDSLLPFSDGGWTVSVSRQGGFGGHAPNLVAVINSDGIKSCGPESDTYKTEILDPDLIADIGSFINASDFKKLRKEFKPGANFCNDCFVNTLKITVREKKKIRNHEFTWSVFPDSGTEIRGFYEKVLSTAACQTK